MAMFALPGVDEAVSGGKSPAGKGANIVCLAEMAHFFRFIIFILHFVR